MANAKQTAMETQRSFFRITDSIPQETWYWAALGSIAVSAALLLLAVYLPGLHTALGLRPPAGADWVTALIAAGLGGNAAQLGAALIGRGVRRE